MPNFFTDNQDMLDFLEHMDIRDVVAMQEDLYTQSKEYEFAPVDYEDAVDSYRRVLELVGKLSAEFVEPRASEVDEEGAHFDGGKVTYARGMQQSLKQLSQADLMGFTLPRRYGGLNMPMLIYTMAIEMVSQADASLMNIFGLQSIADTINSFASEETKEQYLPRFASGEVTGEMELTEPDAGSDLTNVQLKASLDEESGTWHLDGVKRFITNGCAEVLLVLARSEPGSEGARGLSVFLCESDATLRVRRIEDKLGIHGSPTCELQFSSTPATLIGTRRRGLSTYVMELMNGARLAIAAQGVGIAQAALVHALEYARGREQFGQEIRRFPAVRQMLGDMHMKVETARLLAYETAAAVDMTNNLGRAHQSGLLKQLPNGAELSSQRRSWKRLAGALTPIAKYYATETCNEVCYDAIQVMGGSGYMKDYDLERFYRDARITTIYEGTTQIQHNAAVGHVLRGFFEERFQQLAETSAAASSDALEALREARLWLKEAVDFANAQDEPFQALSAARLVESATHIYNGYLLLDPATRTKHKEALLECFLADVLPLVKLRRDQILRGCRTYLDRMPALFQYE